MEKITIVEVGKKVHGKEFMKILNYYKILQKDENKIEKLSRLTFRRIKKKKNTYEKMLRKLKETKEFIY